MYNLIDIELREKKLLNTLIIKAVNKSEGSVFIAIWQRHCQLHASSYTHWLWALAMPGHVCFILSNCWVPLIPSIALETTWEYNP